MDLISDACTHQTELFETPPAKKQRLEVADTATSTEVTTPMDDMDDIYDTPQACGSPQRDERASPTCTGEENPSVAIQPTFNLPGLGMANVITANGELAEETMGVSEQVQMGQQGRPESQADTLKIKGGTEHAMATMRELHEGLVGSGNSQSGCTEDSMSTRVLGESAPTPSQNVAEHKAGLAREGGATGKVQVKAIKVQSRRQELGNEEDNDIEAALQLDHPQEATMLQSIAEGTDLAERLPKVMDTVGFATVTRTPTPAQPLVPASYSSERADIPTAVNKDPESKADEQARLEQAEAKQTRADAEFELDSSPILSSSSDVSSDSSSSDSDDYEMLDPEEQARRLMQEDGGSDDEVGKRGVNAGGGGPLRTLNEKPDEEVQKPNVAITPDMKIEELGYVENLVENIVLIKAKTSGEYQVLETGSVLCLEDRTVIGVVAETLGRVQQPLYSVRFTNAAAISEAGIARGTRIFYVEQHSTYVFTQLLKAFKGSDASNLHDEEVGDDEVEFSDDEAEVEHKRRLKMQRQTKRGGLGGVRDGSSRGNHRNGTNRQSRLEEVFINYDDTVDSSQYSHNQNRNDDELYTPLARPSNLHEMMAQRGPLLEGNSPRGGVDRDIHGSRGRGERGRGRGRGRGDRGRGHRGGRDDRGERRGGGGGKDYVNRTDGGSQQPREADGHRDGRIEPQYINHNTPSMSHAQTAMVPPYPPHNSSFTPQAYQPQYPQQYSQTTPQLPYTPSPSYPSQTHPPPQAPQPAYHPYPQGYGHTPQYPSHESYGQHQNPPRTGQNHGIPAGAFVNPAFFGNIHHQPPTQQQNTDQQHWMTQSTQARPQQSNYGNGPARMLPESDAAFIAAQDRLNVLRQLSQGSGPP